MKIILPTGWKEVAAPIKYQRCFVKFNGLAVLVGEFDHEGEKWLHVSCSHKNKLPKWKELQEVKDIFIGKTRKGIQVFPPESKHVNIMNFCLHIWSNLDRDVLPDFESFTGMI